MIEKRIIIVAVSILFALATAVHADPKTDCEQVVDYLGYSTAGCSFEKAGFFALEKHYFGSVTCYIDPYDKVYKITRMDETIAEDGFFGEEVLAARSEIKRLTGEEILLARSLRDNLIKEARASYDTSTAILLENRDTQLAKLRKK